MRHSKYKPVQSAIIGLRNLCVKKSPVTTSNNKGFDLNSEPFCHQLMAIERKFATPRWH